MGRLQDAFSRAKEYWWRLNEDQRKHISKIFDTLAMGSIAPYFFRLISNDISGEGIPITLCIISAIVFEICAIVALTQREE